MIRATLKHESQLTHRIVCAAVLSLLTVGCGGEGAEEVAGSVSGKVTFKDAPVTEGIISFLDLEKGTGGSGTLESDGTYSLDNEIPVGTYKVTVNPPEVEMPADIEKTVPPQKDPKDIPQSYRSTDTTALTATVKEGTNQHDFNMKD